MFSHDLSLTQAEIVSLCAEIIGDEEAKAAPTIRLIQALTDPKNLDKAGNRTVALQYLYTRLEIFRKHYREDLGEVLEENEAELEIHASSAAAS